MPFIQNWYANVRAHHPAVSVCMRMSVQPDCVQPRLAWIIPLGQMDFGSAWQDEDICSSFYLSSQGNWHWLYYPQTEDLVCCHLVLLCFHSSNSENSKVPNWGCVSIVILKQWNAYKAIKSVPTGTLRKITEQLDLVMMVTHHIAFRF